VRVLLLKKYSIHVSQGRLNVFLGLKRNLNRGFLSAFRENKTKLIKKIYEFPKSKVILYVVCPTIIKYEYFVS